MKCRNLFIIGVALIINASLVFLTFKIYNRLGEKVNKKDVVQMVKDALYSGIINEKLVHFLKVYTAYDKDGPLVLIRHGRENDGGYIAPVKALVGSDVLLGYGIDNDNSFEDDFSLVYNKPSYGFDCGLDSIASKSTLFTFVKQCISSDKFLYSNAKTKSIGQVSSFSQQISEC